MEYVYLHPKRDPCILVLRPDDKVQFGQHAALCPPHGEWWLSGGEDEDGCHDGTFTVKFHCKGDDSQLKVTEFKILNDDCYLCSELQKVLLIRRDENAADEGLFVGASFHYMHAGRITCTLTLTPGGQVVYHDPRLSATNPHGSWEFQDGILSLRFSYTGSDSRIGATIIFHALPGTGAFRDESKERVMVLQ